ncbi:MAG: ROK family protein [Phycisphaeraceae bacterium]
MHKPSPESSGTSSETILLGLDIGGTKCSALIGTAAGDVLDRLTWPSDAAHGPDAMLDDLIGHARALINRHKGELAGAGVVVGGPLDSRRGLVLSPPNLPGWDNIPLRSRLEDALSMPVGLEHDAAACALAEYHWGAGRGEHSVAYLTCGTGFGMGLVIDGVPYYGAGGHSCEIGHVLLEGEGPVAFGKAGSVEAFCAGASLPKLAAWKYPDRWRDAAPTGPELSDLAGSGDADARSIIDVWSDSVARVAASIADTLFCDVIILGSLARYLGPEVFQAIHEAYLAQVHPHARDSCRLCVTELGNRLQDSSALAAATRARSIRQ